MDVQIEELSSIKKKLNIQVSYEDYLKEIEKAYQKLGQQVSIKGFRKGKVPRGILERHYKEQTEADALGHLIEHSYIKALEQEKLQPVGSPSVKDIQKEKGKPISFVAEIETFPQVEARDYKELPLKIFSLEVKDSDIQEELVRLQAGQAQMVPVEGDDVKAQSGHVALVDFEGYLKGEVFEGGSGKGVSIELGAGHFLKDFEKGVLGMKKGENKKIEVVFPTDYPNAKLAGQNTEFDIQLNDLKIKSLPELDDEFAKDLGQFESLAQVKEKIAENLKYKKEQDQKRDETNQILDYLISKHSSIEVPELLIEQEVKALYENTLSHLQQQGLSPEKAGLVFEQYRVQNRENALRRIKAFLLFDSISKQEKIEVSESELRDRIAEIAKNVGQNVEVVENYYRQSQMMSSLFSQIREEKILDFIRQNAKFSN
ncbi:MAG: trigger factor [Deltaproteobacteria bacterium]|nr:trigger factor [Deltaproteobacteria bacterium]